MDLLCALIIAGGGLLCIVFAMLMASGSSGGRIVRPLGWGFANNQPVNVLQVPRVYNAPSAQQPVNSYNSQVFLPQQTQPVQQPFVSPHPNPAQGFQLPQKRTVNVQPRPLSQVSGIPGNKGNTRGPAVKLWSP